MYFHLLLNVFKMRGGWQALRLPAGGVLLKEGRARDDHRAIKSEPRRGSVGVRWFGMAHHWTVSICVCIDQSLPVNRNLMRVHRVGFLGTS